jgi:hypothetical protein
MSCTYGSQRHRSIRHVRPSELMFPQPTMEFSDLKRELERRGMYSDFASREDAGEILAPKTENWCWQQ